MNDKFFEYIRVRSTNWIVKDDCLSFPDRGKLVGLGNLNKAEKNLIVAAPEMLEALVKFLFLKIKAKPYNKEHIYKVNKIIVDVIEKATNKPIDEVLRLWEESCE